MGKHRWIKPITICLSCLLIAALIWQYCQNRIVSVQYLDQQGISHSLNLPLKDKKKLATLMQKLFAENCFAYTVLGSKPISWETYKNPLPLSNWTKFYESFSQRDRIIRSGWKTWQKYEHFFPMANLWAEKPKCRPGWVSILIVNEDRLNEVVIKNKKDFEDVLCREIVDGYQLINERRNSSFMNEVLHGHQALMGIVLGYGRDNSWKFYDGCKHHQAIGWVWENDNRFFIEDLKYSSSNQFSENFCPSFAGEPNSAESLALKAEYLTTKQKVLKYYKGKDFLEASLSLLAGYRPSFD